MNKEECLQIIVTSLKKNIETYIQTATLANLCSKTERSIQQYIQELTLKFPADFERHKFKGIRLLNPNFQYGSIPTLAFDLSAEEINTLQIASLLVEQLHNPVLDKYFQAILYKLTTSLPQAKQKKIKATKDYLSAAHQVHNHPSVGNYKDINLILEAIVRKRCVSFAYESLYVLQDKPSSSCTKTRSIEPLHLRLALGTWYVIGYCHNNLGIRTFSLNQMKSLLLLDKPVTYDIPFDVNEHISSSQIFKTSKESPFKVSCTFKDPTASWVRSRQWFPEQRFKPLKTLSTPLRMDFISDSEVDILLFIQQFGDNVTLLRPRKLVEKIYHQARFTVNKHALRLKNQEKNVQIFGKIQTELLSALDSSKSFKESIVNPANKKTIIRFVFDKYVNKAIRMMLVKTIRDSYKTTEDFINDFYVFIDKNIISLLEVYDPEISNFQFYLLDRFYQEERYSNF